MSTKKELQLVLKTFGYDINSKTSKNTLLNLLHFHSKALKQGIDISKMDDRALRWYLNKYNILTGPIISHTRAIYQHQLLKAISNIPNEDVDDHNDKYRRCSINDGDGIVTRNGKIISRNAQ